MHNFCDWAFKVPDDAQIDSQAADQRRQTLIEQYNLLSAFVAAKRQAPATPWLRAMGSCGNGELQRVRGGAHLALLDFFGNHPQRKRLSLQRRFLGS